jgi:glycosyltransferase involved in cell wall biosynthesis
LSERARSHVELNLSPSKIAGRYRDAIETFHAASRGARIEEALTAVGHLDGGPPDRRQWLAVARSFARTFPRPGPRQLLVDISMLVDRDLKTGIERVTRSLLLQLLENPPQGFRVEPVYSRPGSDGYRYARNFTLRFLDCPADHMEDAPIEYHGGDVFLGLELAHAAVSSHGGEFADMRRVGVGIYFMVYDLLPMTLPQHFFPHVREAHEAWLSTVASHADALICISRATADDLAAWLASRSVPRARPLRIDWIHLGADLDPHVSSRGLPDDASDVLAKIRARQTFLMVGTVEPRKGHAQALAAFEHLWGIGEDINLVIVGKHGWKVEALTESVRAHREFDRRLFWLEGIADEYLEKVYAESACLIAAAEGEGFGLPLVEAARHKIPIIARDIPVFREIAGEHATYFSSTDRNGLQHALEEWIALFRAGRHQRSDDMPWLTWAQSGERLKTIILDGARDRRTVRAMAAAG